MRSTKIKVGVVGAAVCAFTLMLAGWATGAQTAAAPVGSGKASATKSICGLGTGKKATGRPIKLGGIAMLIPGVDFTTIGKVAKAYFDCVNDNGGIRGRPIQYVLYNEQLNPAQQASLARKLVESDKVVGIVGNTSFTECGTNWKYYRSKGYTVIGAGVQAECFGTPTFVETNMGPRYSNIGAAQALVRAGAKSIVVASPSTIAAYADGGALKVAERAGLPNRSFPVTLPVTDANTIIRQLYQAAGEGGGIILDFTPDTAPALMKAAIAQGLVDKVKWGSSTPIANTFMAGQFPEFDGKLFVNSEFGLLDASQGPDTRLMLAVLKRYTKIDPQAFAQMGFMAGKFATQALLNVKGAVTAKSYNAAVRGLKNVKTDMLCKPWYVGNNLPYHIPNNWDITVDYRDGKVVLKEKCFAIAAVDQELVRTRVWEKRFNLNTAK
ncbi:MAG TPA: ABC transporter substrate-binding protein [Gaiella sp.]|uniref:ABC transporter substrate-binding protein n=1 Tax=Gaiella sp. TaxID=2663207 RepID=UPI002D7E78BB|nr:ABC transporter substrate-binding protein [Gaiella sp.]HET9288732.1 ABC transporter substrate-binding protein [Gaiella sp.]